MLLMPPSYCPFIGAQGECLKVREFVRGMLRGCLGSGTAVHSWWQLGSQGNVSWDWKHWAPAGPFLTQQIGVVPSSNMGHIPPLYLKPELLIPHRGAHLFLLSTSTDGLMCAQHGAGGMRTKLRPTPFLHKAEDTFASPHSTSPDCPQN